MDVLTHAIESYVSVMASDYTRGLSLQAIKLVFENLEHSYHFGDEESREKMHNASTMAGMAFANAFLGVCHSMAHKLGSQFHIPHGLAMSFCAPFSVGFNYIANPEKYAIVADILRGDDRSGCMSVMDRAADVEDAFRDLLNDLDIATGLSNYGVKREDLPACADRAFAAKRLLNNNPRAASRDQILALLEANFEA